jgi:hypothetical protein
MAVGTNSLVVTVIAVVADPLARGFPAEVEFDAVKKPFEFFAEAGVRPIDLLFDDAPKEFLTGLARSGGEVVNVGDEIVGKVEVNLGHVLTIGRGIC